MTLVIKLVHNPIYYLSKVAESRIRMSACSYEASCLIETNFTVLNVSYAYLLILNENNSKIYHPRIIGSESPSQKNFV